MTTNSPRDIETTQPRAALRVSTSFTQRGSTAEQEVGQVELEEREAEAGIANTTTTTTTTTTSTTTLFYVYKVLRQSLTALQTRQHTYVL